MRECLEDAILVEILTKMCLDELRFQQDHSPLLEPWGGYFSKTPEILALNVMGKA